MVKTTLPTDSAERKNIPLASGCRDYFPAALVGVADWSRKGNDKHNPGQELHHARGKSMDHEDCIERHSMDLADILAAIARLQVSPAAMPQDYAARRSELVKLALDEYDARCWRALAASQEFREKEGLAPLAPRARVPSVFSLVCAQIDKEEILRQGPGPLVPIHDGCFGQAIPGVSLKGPSYYERERERLFSEHEQNAAKKRAEDAPLETNETVYREPEDRSRF